MVVNSNVLDAKSVHNFVWPFEVCDAENISKVRRQIIARGWKPKEWDPLEPDNFMLRQYMHSSVRDVYMNPKTKTCTVYEMDPSEL